MATVPTVTLSPVQLQSAFVHKFGPIGDVYTSRIVYTITKKGNRHRRVLLVSKNCLFVADLEGVVRRVVSLDEVQSGFSNGAEVLLQMKSYRTDPSVFVEEIDIPENTGMLGLLSCISSLKTQFEITKCSTPLQEMAYFKKSEGYNSPMLPICKVHRRKGLPPSPPEKDHLRQELQRQLTENRRLSNENHELRKQMPASPLKGEWATEEVKRLQENALKMPDLPRFVFIPTDDTTGIAGACEAAKILTETADTTNKMIVSQAARQKEEKIFLKHQLQQAKEQLRAMHHRVDRYEQQNREMARMIVAATPSVAPSTPLSSEVMKALAMEGDSVPMPPPRVHHHRHEVDVRNTEMIQNMLAE